MKTCELCGLALEYLGRLKEDSRKVWACRKCDRAWAENEIPTTLLGPTPSEIERFKDEHPDAEACPECGFKYIVSIYRPSVAVVDGFCFVCNHSSRESVN